MVKSRHTIMAQVDHYLAVSGFDCWYIAALIFGKELVIHKIVISDKQVLWLISLPKEEHFLEVQC